MQTVIYARYSSQLQNARSIEDQIAVCQERATREGWAIVEVFTDYAISGAAGIEASQRPGLAAMLDRVERGGITQVLAESTDRIARNLVDATVVRERLNFAGARLFTLSDGEVTFLTGTFKGMMDAQFRQELGAKIKRGQRGTVAQGRAPAGIAYGYRRANRLDERGELIRGLRAIDPDQAATVIRIFSEYADGRSPRAIAQTLNAEGIPAPHGATWRTTTILGDRQRQNGMLNNRLYAGVMVHNRTSKVTNPRTRRTVIKPNPRSEWIEQPAPELRIVEEALWLRVQARRDESEGARPEYHRRAKHLLSGLGRCGICGGGWIRTTGEYWACGRHKDGRGCTNNRTIKNSTYEREVLAGLQDQLRDPEAVAVYVRALHRIHAERAGELARTRTTLQRKHDEAARKVARLIDVLGEGGREFSELREAFAKAKTDRDRLARELADVDALPVITLHPGIADDYLRQIDALGDALASDGPEALQAPEKVRKLIDHVELTPKTGKARGVDVRVVGRLAELIGLATAEPMPAARAHIR